MSKLRLLMLNYEFPPIGGGAGHAHYCLLRQYAGDGELNADVLTSAEEPGFFAESFAGNIRVFRVGLHKRDLHHWRKGEVVEWLVKAQSHYRRLLKQNEYDLVHAFFGFPSGWLCRRSAGTLPYVISLRGSDVPGGHARLKLDYKVLAPVFRSIWRRAGAIVACSEGLRRRALEFLPSVPIEVIPNGVDLEQFHPAESPRQGDSVALVTVGRLSVTKRVELLIDAAEILGKAGCKVCLTIVGGGPLEAQLRRYASQKTLRDTVKIIGSVEAARMPELYRQNEIFVSATAQEGMSNAMLEAMASGLAIVTTRCEGVEELIADNGIVVEQARADKIAEAVRRLVYNRHACRQMGEAARTRAAMFGWAGMADKYMRCYERVLAGPAARKRG